MLNNKVCMFVNISTVLQNVYFTYMKVITSSVENEDFTQHITFLI